MAPSAVVSAGRLGTVTLAIGACYLGYRLVSQYKRKWESWSSVLPVDEQSLNISDFPDQVIDDAVTPTLSGETPSDSLPVTAPVNTKWRYRKALAKWIVMARVKFGAISDSKANRLVVDQWVRETMDKSRMRKVDILKVHPMVCEAVFVPSHSQIAAKRWRHSSEVKDRREMWKYAGCTFWDWLLGRGTPDLQ